MEAICNATSVRSILSWPAIAEPTTNRGWRVKTTEQHRESSCEGPGVLMPAGVRLGPARLVVGMPLGSIGLFPIWFGFRRTSFCHFKEMTDSTKVLAGLPNLY